MLLIGVQNETTGQKMSGQNLLCGGGGGVVLNKNINSLLPLH